MSVINPDEWHPVARMAVGSLWAADCHDLDIRAAAAVLCLLDLARYGTVQWFPDTDPADVPWAPEPEPEWVRCLDPNQRRITAGKVYRVEGRNESLVFIKCDDGSRRCYFRDRFVPATADEATVTIDVPVAWAQWARDRNILKGWPGQDHEQRVRDACREALTKAGLL